MIQSVERIEAGESYSILVLPTYIPAGTRTVVKQTIDHLWDVLKELRSSPAYEQMLKDAIRQGVEELGGSCVVYAAQDDLESVQKLSAAYPQLVVSKEPIESAGGVVLVSSDGGIRFESTLESLIEESMESIRLEVYKHIFGEER